MLAVGRALMSKPRLLLLDEPSIGLAPVVVDQIADIVTTVSKGGTDVLIVEQNAALALELAEDAYVLENGRIHSSGTAAEITPIREVDDRTVGEGHRGPVTKELQGAFFAPTKGETERYASWLTYVND